jgi:cysteinyl-tRNA synthetase
MKIHLTNSLTKQKEEFTPINASKISMYACGPTVYDRPHLGNARAAVTYDVLFRLLRAVYKNVVYARNITDVDDKIIAACKSGNISFKDLTSAMIDHYHEDVEALNCLQPTHEPKATEYIAEMIEMIEQLIFRGHAYEAKNHVLFRVGSYKDYGKLSNRSMDEMIAGARVEVAPFKENPADFVLWKPSPSGEEDFGFDSPWGKGRPGWHIECSAMTHSLLGDHFDIHGGGADLMFPHHENEIAQSTCSSDHNHFANYWVHNGFLMVNGEKMSKSLGNFKTVRELLDAGIEGCVIRYLYLTTHYRKPLDFTDKAVDDVRKAINKFRNAIGDNKHSQIKDEFLECLADDMNTPLYISKMHHYAELAHNSKDAQEALLGACELIGLDLKATALQIPDAVKSLAEERQKARDNKNWAESDRLRDEIQKYGYTIKDTQGGKYEFLAHAAISNTEGSLIKDQDKIKVPGDAQNNQNQKREI